MVIVNHGTVREEGLGAQTSKVEASTLVRSRSTRHWSETLASVKSTCCRGEATGLSLYNIPQLGSPTLITASPFIQSDVEDLGRLAIFHRHCAFNRVLYLLASYHQSSHLVSLSGFFHHLFDMKSHLLQLSLGTILSSSFVAAAFDDGIQEPLQGNINPNKYRAACPDYKQYSMRAQ